MPAIRELFAQFDFGFDQAGLSAFVAQVKGAEKAVRRLARSVDRVGRVSTRSVRPASKNLREHGSVTDRAARSQGRLNDLLSAGVWMGFAGGVARATGRLAEFAFAAQKSLVETAGWSQRTQQSLSMISGLGASIGKQEFEEATNQAAELGLAVRETVDQYKLLRGVGFQRGQAGELVGMAADAKAVLGLTDEQISRTFYAIGQIRGAGVLQGDELRQLAETGIDLGAVWDKIAAQLHVTVPQAKKLKEEGKVTAEVAISAFQAAVAEKTRSVKPGDAARQLASTTLSGQLDLAKGQLAKWWIGVAQEATPALAELAGKLGETFTKFSKDGRLDRAVAGVKRLLFDLIDLISIRWPDIERVMGKVLGAVGDDLWGLIGHLDSLLDTTIRVTEFIADHWEAIRWIVTAAVATLGVSMVGLGVQMLAGPFLAAGKLIGKLRKLVGVFPLLSSAAQKAGPAVSSVLGSWGGAAATFAGKLGLAAAALGALYMAWDQWQQLQAETKADGGPVKAVVDAVRRTGDFAGFVRSTSDPGGELQSKLDIRRMNAEARIRAADRTRRAQETQALLAPTTLRVPGTAGATVSVVDSRSIEVNVSTGSGSAAEVAKQVGVAVRSAPPSGLEHIEQALVGGGNG